jgi:hypothetical protein
MDNLIKTNKNIEVGKFYFIHDGSKTGHPGLVFWKDDAANRYLIIRFDSDKYGVETTKEQRRIKHITKLKHPIDDKVMNSYARNRPMLCKRKDIGFLMSELSIKDDDIQTIEEIKNNNPELGPSLRK